jgi:pyridoxal/pyridoxine/pyridoxamine kinase
MHQQLKKVCTLLPVRVIYLCICVAAGDLLAALLLARIHSSPGNLAGAVELAVAGLQGVLANTAAAAGPAAIAADDRWACVC